MSSGSDKPPLFVGATIRKAREERSLTQEDLQKLSGVSRKHIGQVERGGNVSVDVLIKIANALELRTIQLETVDLTFTDGRRISAVDVANALTDISSAARKVLELIERVAAQFHVEETGEPVRRLRRR